MEANGFSVGLEQLYQKLVDWWEMAIQMLPNVIIAIIIVITFCILAKCVSHRVEKLFWGNGARKSIQQLLSHITKISIICLGVVLALGVLGLQKIVFSLLAGVGVVGFALGFAFQDLAANFVSGVMLALREPIKIGDLIEINGTMGNVVAIRLRDTIVRNFSGQDIFIPNKDFTSSKFTNYSCYGRRKLTIEVGVSYDDDPSKAVEVLAGAVKKVEGILLDPEPVAFVNKLGASSVDLVAHFWFKFPGGDGPELTHKALVLAKKELEAAGFSIPYPTQTLYFNNEQQE